MRDWYKIRTSQVREKGGSGLLSLYGGSLMRVLQTVYPEYHWNKFDSDRLPRNFFNDIGNQRLFMDKLGTKLDIKHLDDWYIVSTKDVLQNGGGRLLNIYGGSLVQALQTIYPEHSWHISSFATVPRGYWSLQNQRQFFDGIAKRLKINTLDDWYNVTHAQVLELGAGSVLRYHDNSLMRALQAVYPEHPWDFPLKCRNYWKRSENQRDFVKKMEQQLNITDLDGWYSVTTTQLQERGGSGLLSFFGGSLLRLLRTVYPEHKWQAWKFARIGVDASEDEITLHEYIVEMSKELEIKDLDDWYRVSRKQIRKFRGYGFITRNGGLFTVLKKLYPDHPWDANKFFARQKKADQRWLLLTAKRLFPDTEILEEYMHPDLTFEGGELVEFDIYLPSLKLAFEYQGEQHYEHVPVFSGSSNGHQQRRDEQKAEICQRAGITLIVVPYWWDRKQSSIAESIHAVRPDLLMNLVD
eukprot:GEZU01000413.1.p1 GENE.GEZU01000413.1~~GEZU01000413.1.p1  ORF type:complete len:468 (+),score=89.89 GEZU01000413.1:405-1808(+)